MNTTKRIFALGFFDGVHLGHQTLLKECTALSRKLGYKPAAITFDLHPKSLFTPDSPPLLSTAGTRQELLQRYGIAQVYTFPVVQEVMSMPWQDFLRKLMEYGAAGFVCGHDFRFGHKGEGTPEKLQEFCRQQGFPCVIVPEQDIGGIRISSSYIRQQLESGDMATAVRFLGHPYLLSGTVVHGKKIGRTLGIPTANLVIPEGLVIPKFGVYACACLIDGVRYPAVTNIGTRPTVSGQGITVEPWILDFSGDLYDRPITLEFYRFLRPETRFPDLSALQAQIHLDAEQTRAFLKEQI